MKKITIAASLTIVALTTIATLSAQAAKQRYQKEETELALFSCLATNYKKLGVDITAHDYSIFHPRYIALTEQRSVESDLKYFEFIEIHTGGFYKDEIGVKAETSKPPYTTIFAKCVAFSESKELRNFISKSKL